MPAQFHPQCSGVPHWNKGAKECLGGDSDAECGHHIWVEVSVCDLTKKSAAAVGRHCHWEFLDSPQGSEAANHGWIFLNPLNGTVKFISSDKEVPSRLGAARRTETPASTTFLASGLRRSPFISARSAWGVIRPRTAMAACLVRPDRERDVARKGK